MSERIPVKKQIKKAFLQMLEEKPYLEITVSDIVKKANVARMSFYRNFNSVDDILEELADEIISEFTTFVLPIIKESNLHNLRELLFSLFYHFIDIQKRYGIPRKDIDSSYHKVILSRVRKKVTENLETAPFIETRQSYIEFGKMNFIMGIFSRWASLGMKEPPEEIINLIISQLQKLI